MRQFGSETNTQEVTPLVVCNPKPTAQLAQALIEVNVTQFVAAGTIHAVELSKKKLLTQALQVKLAEYILQLLIRVEETQALLLRKEPALHWMQTVAEEYWLQLNMPFGKAMHC